MRYVCLCRTRDVLLRQAYLMTVRFEVRHVGYTWGGQLCFKKYELHEAVQNIVYGTGGKDVDNSMTELEQIWKRVTEGPADAAAWIQGSENYPELEGYVLFYGIGNKTLVVSSLEGLKKEEKECGGGFLGFHIHDGSRCAGTMADPFADSGMHYNPGSCSHPLHAGDLPPVLISDGKAFGAVLTAAFTPDEVRGRTVILHAQPDDFTTQPAGNSGAKIACGRII